MHIDSLENTMNGKLNKTSLTGKKFIHLTVIYQVATTLKRDPVWRCACVCGKFVSVDQEDLPWKTSCGCLPPLSKHSRWYGDRFYIHGQSRTAEYQAWSSAKQRCTNPKNASYKYYGARGIRMAPVWLKNFKAFFKHIGKKPNPSLILDRIDSTGDYEPGNVRWVTVKEQVNNRRCSKK